MAHLGLHRRRWRLVVCWALCVLPLGSVAARAERPPRVSGRSTLVRLYQTHAAQIEKRFASEYQEALRDGLPDTPDNKQRFLKAFFVFSLVHDKGILGNLWELVDSYPDSDRRLPTTLFKETFARPATPPVTQQREGDGAAVTCVGYSHGRCDRLEMEFIALLSFLGVESEMYMSGPIHVRTEVVIDGHYLVFDNSFSRFKLRTNPGLRVPPAKPYSVKHANQLAHAEAARIACLPLAEADVLRVEQAITSYLDGGALTWCKAASK